MNIKTHDQILVEIPEIPKGWGRKLVMHMRFGRHGSASYDLYDEKQRRTGIFYVYNTKTKSDSFSVKLGGESMTWHELRARYVLDNTGSAVTRPEPKSDNAPGDRDPIAEPSPGDSNATENQNSADVQDRKGDSDPAGTDDTQQGGGD